MNNIGNKIYNLRKEKGLSQEDLANILDVSRQAVQKWESGNSKPEIDKLINIANYFSISLDELCTGKVNQKEYINNRRFNYEYKSKSYVYGIPLVHININSKINTQAKGILAIGNIAIGIVSLGFISIGLLSFGFLSLALLSIGLFAFGGLSIGCISIGLFAIGSIAYGYISLGALSVGKYGIGAYFKGHIGVADKGSADLLFDINSLPSKEQIINKISRDYPKTPNFIKTFLSNVK